MIKSRRNLGWKWDQAKKADHLNDNKEKVKNSPFGGFKLLLQRPQNKCVHLLKSSNVSGLRSFPGIALRISIAHDFTRD